MSALAVRPSTSVALANVRAIEAALREMPQIQVVTHHVLHGGTYHRTIALKAGEAISGCHVIKPTTLTIYGHVTVDSGDGEPITLHGYHVIPASAGRKQAFIAHTDTILTMSLATDAKTVEEAERDFTDEAEMLASRNGVNHVVITGE